MKDISVTQVSNYGALVGVVMLLLNHFKINIAKEEVDVIIASVLTLGSLLVNIINRYKKGDIRLSGVKKTY
jgi:uncharacterized YccA/Bax inhibitor family protein